MGAEAKKDQGGEDRELKQDNKKQTKPAKKPCFLTDEDFKVVVASRFTAYEKRGGGKGGRWSFRRSRPCMTHSGAAERTS